MTEYPQDIKFKYSWRKYQQRVLDELQDHLSDEHLHVIAPPGSGKTVLGLEVAIRLNKPTLILAPTIAIRNQWIQRFCELFLQTTLTPDWISRDIRNPKFMTVVTYQGLHAACNNWRNEEEIDDEEEVTEEDGNDNSNNSELKSIVSGLKSQNIKTIVVDEAHHLKNEWWQTLTKVKEKLQPIIVGLTATPPYDVSATEWQRYISLNGPVDAEISVPELVLEGDLCPHQDYVHFTLPTEKENRKILEFRLNIEKLFQEIKTDETIIKAIEQHPIWKKPTEQLDWIYNNLSYYSACLIFLKSNEKEIPETHLEVIGDRKFKIPNLDYEWIETLLDFYLYKEKEHFKNFEEHQKSLENKLRRYGAIERRQINFSHNKRLTGFLTSSISKLSGIKEIVDFEYNQLGKDLRMVILSDFIRKEFFIKESENNLELNKIGIIPIFEKLRRENKDNKRIAVLTGSLIIIPVSAYSAFEAKAAKIGINQVNSSPVSYDSDYVLINQTDQLKHDIVHLVTQIFQSGEIEVLIGTKSLLGEGWDAPAINSLVLASFVGSFVLSNQMRGRAIRAQNGNVGKTGNIWHLACIDPTSQTGGDDFDLLKRRFRSFVGVSFKEEAGIENGIGRLNISENIHLKEEVEKKNIEMFSYAGDRESLKQRWKTALETGVNLVEEIKIPFPEEKEYNAVKSLYLYKTIGNLLAALGSGLVAYATESIQAIFRSARNIRTIEDLYFYLGFFGGIGVLIFGRLTFKTLILYLKYRDISKDIQQIGDALLNSLIKAGLINTDYSKLKVETTVDNSGSIFCHLEGGTTYDKSTFINALQEVIAPIDNPRYVIIRKNMFMLFIKQKDYHSVPEALGRNKNLAEYFKDQWERLVGSCDLIYTRTLDGRKLLLRSRVKSLSAQFDEKVEHVNKWK
ncbi:DEAD/DEAH box helicase family protein [Weeksellaceae bacterium KMM 9713]|uniref:DEAD/DEAH box helicase family protein n=1 Tax=Profundicola chukchiensis TaxID=2961959 RepID=A0A9X4MWW1_9FLAO|nr:DEAD/DEAH box helicase family protein [Profundicola chukchiensis]MDG4945469.1 DEAD/DEAH box helicase family protein [Profundicola chukchiensis]